MIRLARTYVAMPGKYFEVLAVAKEVAAIVEKVAGVKVTIFTRLGGKVGEVTSVTNYNSLADLEERAAKLLASPEFQTASRKWEGLIVPGEYGDRLMREV